MKKILTAIFLASYVGASAFVITEEAGGKCNPKGKCTACKNCSGCKNCAKNGGSCSVCR